MANYEYKVDYLEAKVTDKDVKQGTAWPKIAAQSETKLTEWNEQGWEFFRSEAISTTVQETSCFGRPTGDVEHTNILIFVFRREVR